MHSTPPAADSISLRARIARGLFAIYPATLVLSLVLAGFVPLVVKSARGDFLPTWRPRRSAAADILLLCNAIDEFVSANGGRFPETLDILYSEDVNGQRCLADPSVLIDPWGLCYGYELPRIDRGYRVFTLGRDGAPGGSGDDADIDNFSIANERKR